MSSTLRDNMAFSVLSVLLLASHVSFAQEEKFVFASTLQMPRAANTSYGNEINPSTSQSACFRTATRFVARYTGVIMDTGAAFEDGGVRMVLERNPKDDLGWLFRARLHADAAGSVGTQIGNDLLLNTSIWQQSSGFGLPDSVYPIVASDGWNVTAGKAYWIEFVPESSNNTDEHILIAVVDASAGPTGFSLQNQVGPVGTSPACGPATVYSPDPSLVDKAFAFELNGFGPSIPTPSASGSATASASASPSAWPTYSTSATASASASASSAVSPSQTQTPTDSGAGTQEEEKHVILETSVTLSLLFILSGGCYWVYRQRKLDKGRAAMSRTYGKGMSAKQIQAHTTHVTAAKVNIRPPSDDPTERAAMEKFANFHKGQSSREIKIDQYTGATATSVGSPSELGRAARAARMSGDPTSTAIEVDNVSERSNKMLAPKGSGRNSGGGSGRSANDWGGGVGGAGSRYTV